MAKIEILLPDNLRIKKNSKRIYARGKFKRVLPSEAYVEWERQARAELLKLRLEGRHVNT